VRCPDGVNGSPGTDSSPGAVRQGAAGARPAFSTSIRAGLSGAVRASDHRGVGRPGTYLTVTEVGSLIGLAQMGVLEIHVWGSSWPDIEHPIRWSSTWTGPGGGVAGLGARRPPNKGSSQGARLESFVKTTGGKGCTWSCHRPAVTGRGPRFLQVGGRGLGRPCSGQVHCELGQGKTEGKIYVDYVRNTRGATAIAPYSTRAHEHATIAVPLRWSELSGRIRPIRSPSRTFDTGWGG